MRIEFRRATHSDCYLLHDWRNDPQTRAASLHTGEVQLNDHLEWLTESLRRPDRQIFIAERLSDKLGTVRADCTPEGIELSWTVAPEHRGRGVGTHMVQQFAAAFRCALIAQVKEANVASRKIAQAAGFECIGSNDGLMMFYRGARPPIGAQQAMDSHKQRATA